MTVHRLVPVVAFTALQALACRGIEPIEAPPPLDATGAAQVELGQRLFFDPLLSAGYDVACASCHDLAAGGDDGRPVSLGTGGQAGRRNAPSVLNASLRFRQFWDGRAETLEAQALGPIYAADEMGLDADELVARLSADPTYPAAFAAAFPTRTPAIHPDTVAAALAAFERRLAWPGRVDRFLQGDTAALTEEERAGYDDFAANCAFCHDGPGVGGQRFERLGDQVPWPADRSADLGRMEITGDEGDRLRFVVPSLRHVARTAPYFHDGSVETLEEAVRLMGEHQLGETFDDARIARLVAFLKALDGDVPAERLAPRDEI